MISRRLRQTESRIIPMARLIKAIIITLVARIAVGKRGTKPVSRYVKNKGYPIMLIEKVKQELMDLLSIYDI